MRIATYFNVLKSEIDSRLYNIVIGISLGNKYFSKENIQQFVEWSIQHTKESVLILIADSIHAINLEIYDEMNTETAQKKAARMSEKKYREVVEAISSLSPHDKNRIHILRFTDIFSETYKNNVECVKQEFLHNKEFHDFIIDIVKKSRKDKFSFISQLSNTQLDRLSEYILTELPFLIGGVEWNNTAYTLIPYPGISEVDVLAVGLQNKTLFPELAHRLQVQNNLKILEVYVD